MGIRFENMYIWIYKTSYRNPFWVFKAIAISDPYPKSAVIEFERITAEEVGQIMGGN